MMGLLVGFLVVISVTRVFLDLQWRGSAGSGHNGWGCLWSPWQPIHMFLVIVYQGFLDGLVECVNLGPVTTTLHVDTEPANCFLPGSRRGSSSLYWWLDHVQGAPIHLMRQLPCLQYATAMRVSWVPSLNQMQKTLRWHGCGHTQGILIAKRCNQNKSRFMFY